MTIKQDRTQFELDQLSSRVYDEFVSQAQRLFTRQITVLERLEENQRANNAVLERIDRNLDYLLRQQKDHRD